jgi:primosomal protein N' (replication factor Y)
MASEPGVDQGAGRELLVEVAVALPLFTTLTYRVPASLAPQVQVGCLVRVPVGRRAANGYVICFIDKKPDFVVKDILAVLDPLPRFGPEAVPLWRWLADYYFYPLGEALRHLVPGGPGTGAASKERYVSLSSAGRGRLGPRGREVVAWLEAAAGPIALSDLRRQFPGCLAVLRRLEKGGWLAWTEAPPQEAAGTEVPAPVGLELTPEQSEAAAAIIQGIQTREFRPYLLHGVTASGKTEVYLTAAAAAVAQGLQVLVLAPEIALTHPVARECRRRFGERVAVLHSGLSEPQRLKEWRRLAAAEALVAVGARSGVVAPLPRLGLIVVDEEHDPAYKHEGGLPYQARDVALYRGKLAGAAVVLASATPSVGSYHHAREGRYQYLHLPQRVTPQSLPEIHLINLKQRFGTPGPKIISPPLAQAVTDTLAEGGQALLFLNRRGFATVVFCLLCGRVFQCRHCSVALTQHRAREVLVCHYCGYTEPLPEACPQCRSTALKKYGVGTERVEAEARRLWPEARVARLDRDTASHSGKGLKVLEDFAQGRIDLLVGTQMVTKGHHFPGVTLVGVIAGDLSLFFPEYHAGERTFQLLAQVAGRAGRGETPGRVFIQTYNPEHYVFQTIVQQDYEAFFSRELEARRQLGYPPFTRLALARLSGTPEEAVADLAKKVAETLRTRVRRDPDLAPYVRVLGPAPASLAKLKNRFRWQILLKSYGRPALAQTLTHLRQLWDKTAKGTIDLTLDIDPGSLV